MGNLVAIPSLALLEANRQLYERRVTAQRERQINGGVDNPADEYSLQQTPLATEAVNAAASFLPPHLGWGSTPLTAHLRRRLHPLATITTSPNHADDNQPAPQTTEQAQEEVNSTSYTKFLSTQLSGKGWIKLYPDIGLGMLRQEMTAPGRLWLMLQALDETGRGCISISTAKELLVGEKAIWPLCGQRQWRNLLHLGERVFWTRDKEFIWLRSTARVGLALGVQHLRGRPVAVPLTAMLGGIGPFRAHLYAAFHSGRSKETSRGRQVMPIARVTLGNLCGVGVSSQRASEKEKKIHVQANFAVGAVVTEEMRETRAWEQGAALFELSDYLGRQGAKGQRYLAWQLPNSYLGQHQHRPKGRQKRINRKLKDLVMQGMPGNIEEAREPQKPEKRYYAHGKQVVQDCGRAMPPDVYWPKQQTRHRHFQIWQQMDTTQS